MGKRKIATIILTVSITAIIVIFTLIQILSILDVLSNMICFGMFFASFIFLSGVIIGLVLLFTSKKAPRERLDFRGDRISCPKCNRRIDIRKAVRPCAVKCQKCNDPVLLDLEREDVKVQCPQCMKQQVHHIEFRPAEVSCKGC
jgi:hypothetical protein